MFDKQDSISRYLMALSCGAALACAPDTNGNDPADSADSTGAADTGDPEDTDESPDPPGELPDMGTTPNPNEQIPPPDAEGCHAIYAQDILPTFELEITEVVWERLMFEWNNGSALEEMGINPKKHHPLKEFRYGEVAIHNAEIRLRGNPSYWETTPGDKMQFQIGFHRNDPDGNFWGIKRILFDAATYNRHMLRDRLSLTIMRDVGLPAPCANSARVVVNGEYYGLFTNIEKVDEVFLERVFDDPTGDLFKRAGWDLKTNRDTSNKDRAKLLRDVESLEELDALLHVEDALRVYATEAIIPNSDGGWAGGLNFYFYDDPLTGKFVLIPWDLDNTFERFNHEPDGEYPTNPDPIVWEKWKTRGRPWYDLALQKPEWHASYIQQIDEIVHTGYDTAKLHGHIDAYTAQIKESVLEDYNKPFSNEKYLTKVEELYGFVEGRYAFIEDWLVCWQNGGVADAEGYCVAP